MLGVRNFTDLLIWKRARTWSTEIFWRTQEGAFSRDQRLVVQINDSTESVMSNIAEGFGRGTHEEFVVVLGYALGSLLRNRQRAAKNDRRLHPVDDHATIGRPQHSKDKVVV